MNALATVPRETASPPARGFQMVDLVDVEVVDNIRTDLGDLSELTASIAELGILQPLGVIGDNAPWRLIYGHRRRAAAEAAGLTEVPVVILPHDAEPAILQLVENLHRRDLPPLDEARAYQALLKDPSLTQDALARSIGRSRPYVTNALRLLEADPAVQKMLAADKLSASHVRALLPLSGKTQRDMAKQVVDYGFSSHRTEDAVQSRLAQEQRDVDEVKQLAKWAEETEARLLELGADKKTTKLTNLEGYYRHESPELKAMKARGWQVQIPSFSRGKCDCTAYGIGVTWEKKTQIVRRCLVQAHYDERAKAEGRGRQKSWEEQDRERKLHDAVVEQVRRGARPKMLAAFRALPPDVARILLWIAMDWSLNDWVRDHKGDRKKPDAWGALTDLTGTALAEELVTFALKGFTDRYNVKLDWPAIAEAFGVTLKEPAPAKTARATKA